jgi:thiamine pyrophosphokinase
VLGDFDSLAPDTLPNVPRIAAADQDHTDIDKAIAYMIAQSASRIVMTAVTGDRLDHTFSALSMLVKYGRKIDISLLDEIGRARLVDDEIAIPSRPGQTFSLLPIGKVEGVATMGLRWELDGDTLQAGVRDGISNEAIGNMVSINCWGGDLIVYWHD